MRTLCTIIMTLLVFGSLLQNAEAQTHFGVDSVNVSRQADSVQVTMKFDLSYVKIENKDLLWLTPRLVNGADSIDLPTLCIYGRNPYYSYVRTGPYAQGADLQIRGKRAPQRLDYVRNVAFEPWMDEARLVLVYAQTNSCGDIVSQTSATIHNTPPIVVAAPPILEERKYTLSGSAYVDFVLDKTDIRPSYHNNVEELGKICAQLDTVLNDTLATLHGMTIHGYASPEGPFAHNVDLARDRTQALKDYITNLYAFPADLIKTDYTPEDWAGFRRFMEQSDLPHKQEIIAIIDEDTAQTVRLDAQLRKIQRQYRNDYRIILRDYFPYLRHSDYTIDYTRRELTERPGVTDTIYRLPMSELMPTTPLAQFPSYTPWFALKTNLLFDLALAVNVEVEVPFGRDQLYSAMMEWWTPWYVWHHNSRAYEFQTLGFELRRWFRKCDVGLPPLSGTFVGAYYANGKYDLEWNSDGNQGEFQSVGATVGYSWVLNRRFNLEASFSAGAFWGPRRHYHGMFNDTHLIWQYTGRTFYFGPTKAKVSLSWLIGPSNDKPKKTARRQKGGAHE